MILRVGALGTEPEARFAAWLRDLPPFTRIAGPLEKFVAGGLCAKPGSGGSRPCLRLS